MAQRYDTYKDSGVQWLGEIPEHWQTSKVGAKFRQRTDKVSEKDFPPLSVAKIGVVPQMEDVAISLQEGNTRKLVRKGDFVVNSRSDRKGSCGVSKYDGSVSLINIVLEPKDIDSWYVHYLFRSNSWIEEFYRHGRGIVADLWTTNYQLMKSMILPIPPLTEQHAIVSYLDHTCGKMDEWIVRKNTEMELLMEMKQRVIADAVTRGLNANVKMKPTNIPWLPEIPEHWQQRKMKYLFDERSEKNHPNEPMLSATQSEGVILQSKYKGRVVVVNTGFEGLKLVRVGDFVIHLRSFQGGIEYTYDQGIISSAYTILNPRHPEYSMYYKILFKSSNFIDLLKTCVTGIREGQNINYSKLKQNFIPVPPITEQNEIVNFINEYTAKIDTLISNINKEIENLKEYKQRLISDVVTGHIKVC